MSGKVAFFPTIDPKVVADLDRHLRMPRTAARPASAAAQTPVRTQVTGVVEAVANAASSISSMSERISDLEASVATLRATNSTLIQQLGQSTQRHEAAEAKARAAIERAEAAESLAIDHHAHGQALEEELTNVTADLNQIMETIATTLGLPEGEWALAG